MKVFVIDDDRAWADYYERVLRGYELEFFHDGVAAIARMDEVRPDAVVLDILLVGPTGFAVLNEMRSYPELANVPVVVVSSVEVAELSDEYGVTAVLDKSKMTPRALREAIDGAVLEAAYATV